MFQPLGQDQADAPGCGVNEHGPPRLNARAALDQRLYGATLEDRRRCGFVVDTVGDQHRLGGRDVALCRVSAEGGSEGADTVSDRELIDPFAHRLDHARRLDPQPGREFERIEAAAVIGVDEVQADSGVAHAHFAGAGGCKIDVTPADRFGAA